MYGDYTSIRDSMLVWAGYLKPLTVWVAGIVLALGVSSLLLRLVRMGGAVAEASGVGLRPNGAGKALGVDKLAFGSRVRQAFYRRAFLDEDLAAASGENMPMSPLNTATGDVAVRPRSGRKVGYYGADPEVTHWARGRVAKPSPLLETYTGEE